MLTRLRVLLSISGLMLFGLAGATSLAAQVGTTPVSPTTTTMTTTTPPTAQVIEWDTPENADGQPGAITADLYGNSSGTIWFTTRLTAPRVYQFQPPANYKYGYAQESSWPLDPLGLAPTGGLKRIRSSFDNRFIYVRTELAVEKIDTVTQLSTTYCDDATVAGADVSTICLTASPVSDLAADHHNFVYYTFNGFLQRLDTSSNNCAPQQACPPVGATQWNLSTTGPLAFTSTAGVCNGNNAATNPCLSGVAVNPKYENLVYVAEPGNNTIAEVDTAAQPCSCPTPHNVRRWDLTQVGAYQPRQINFDQDGKLWIITGSDSTGTAAPSLVSLDPMRNSIKAYNLPAGLLQDTFGVAPDGGMIGYTANDQDGTASGDPGEEHKVGVLIPQGRDNTATPQPYFAPSSTFLIYPQCSSAPMSNSPIKTTWRQVPAKIVSTGNGTFIEGLINRNADGNMQTSMFPLGIAPAFKKAVGTFLYAVGQPATAADGSPSPAVNRVGFIRFPRKGLKAKHEREDKDCNDDGSDQDDQDHDGVPDQYKTNDSKAKMDRQNDALAPGQSMDYNLTTGSSTMAIVAAIQSDNALEPVSVQVIDPSGITLALPVATPGLALATVVPTTPGNYIIRVKNEGAFPINPETQLITREPLSLP
jgi:hypothetical protein